MWNLGPRFLARVARPFSSMRYVLVVRARVHPFAVQIYEELDFPACFQFMSAHVAKLGGDQAGVSRAPSSLLRSHPGLPLSG